MSVLRNFLRDRQEGPPDQTSDGEFFLISDVSERVELEPKTIRFYEKAGLLKPRRIGQLRIFSSIDIEVLLLVKQLRQFGMPIAEIREALALHMDSSAEHRIELKNMLTSLLELLFQKQKKLAEQIAELDSTLGQSENERAA